LPLHIFRLTIQLTTAVFNPIDQSIQSHFWHHYHVFMGATNNSGVWIG
jgi:hypothetical protein